MNNLVYTVQRDIELGNQIKQLKTDIEESKVEFKKEIASIDTRLGKVEGKVTEVGQEQESIKSFTIKLESKLAEIQSQRWKEIFERGIQFTLAALVAFIIIYLLTK